MASGLPTPAMAGEGTSRGTSAARSADRTRSPSTSHATFSHPPWQVHRPRSEGLPKSRGRSVVRPSTRKRPRYWHLLIRREIDTPLKIKYPLSNAPADMPLEQLLYIPGQRYWVERALQDAKRHSGFGDYQVRGWLG